MGYKHDLLQPKQEVFWHLKYSRTETNKAWKIPLEVMKAVYLHSIYFISVPIIGLNITCTKFWNLWICIRPTFNLKTIWTRNTTRVKWCNTCIASQYLGSFICIHLLAQFGMKKSAVRKRYGYDTLQTGQVPSSSHFRRQAPPHMQSRQRP